MKLSVIFLFCAAFAFGTANAAGGPLDLSTGSAGFASTPVAGGFVDTFTFTLTTPSIANSSVTTAVNGAQDIDFSYIAVVGPAGVFSFTQLLGDPFETWALPGALLTPGSYLLTIIGTNSAAVASYGGNLAVTAIPEPDRYALLLAGLTAIGFIVRRRRD